MSEYDKLETNPVVSSRKLEIAPEQDKNVSEEVYRPKLAGFWTRFWAYTIDLIVLYAVSGIFIKPVFRVANLEISNPWFLFFTPYKITILVLLLLYFILMTKYFQQTVGKMIMGIKVVPQKGVQLTWSDLIFREVIGRFISKLLVLPYILVAFMPNKEALHDIFADTYVIHENAFDKRIVFRNMKLTGSEQLPDHPVV